MTQDQLTVMEIIVGVKKTLREIGFTLDWIEEATWDDADIAAVHVPFGDESKLSKADRKGAVVTMSLGTKYVDGEATSGASLLVYWEDMWLNLSCMITGMVYLRHAYKDIGVINPSFYQSQTPADQINWRLRFDHLRSRTGALSMF
ncbi:hypothetical protein JG688_00012537 [Phytophthora aleatoria]|uniref:Uncharacterized protein n=1 Tax=Phytophthora aleatoria TaxID=2496075 RepID=A0A8J5MEB9_9STRA|nr:hypothetical protein JG688_00012537 [Phytophthora aleatoria]